MTTLKMKIYLDTDGQENLALGKTLWPWHYSIRTDGDTPSKGAILIGECEVLLPSKEACVMPVLETLKAREDEINAQAHEDLAAIKLRRDNLLALTYEASDQS